MRVLDVLADATNVIAEGEVLQLMNMHDPDLSVQDYLRVIRFKTAKLFEASARHGGRTGRSKPRSVEDSLRRLWSRSLGTAFQIDRRPARLRRRTPSTWARTSATTCARASPRCRFVDRHGALGTAVRARPDPPRDRTRRGGERLADIVRDRSRHSGAIDRHARRRPGRGRSRPRRRAWAYCPTSVHRDALLELCLRSVDRSF